ncbi:MAG: biopolymer transporter ExbD [Psychrosphaera sp.]|nr:biopolymer transporter ExbD [Psychrosphaera sp.]NQZ08917.1 biopolymer transporter ExbD [Algicola sp.]
MARKRIREDDEAAIDMTPMLDIVFIMLIFFIVSTSFLKETGIEVNKPKAAKPTKNNKPSIFIEVKDSGEIWMGKRLIDIERVGANIERMLSETQTSVVIIKAGKETKHGLVVKVMDAIKESSSSLTISIAGI